MLDFSKTYTKNSNHHKLKELLNNNAVFIKIITLKSSKWNFDFANTTYEYGIKNQITNLKKIIKGFWK